MSLGTVDTYLTRRHARRVQREQAVPERDWAPVPEGSYTLLVLFNLMAAFDEGHAILAVGPSGGDLMTYSYYRRGNALKAPASMAWLREPETFAALRRASGWIVHGNPGNWWNEHVNCAIALWCDEATFRAVQACAEDRRAHTGTYNLITYNCLTFCDEALAAGGIHLLTESGRELHTIVPKDAFRDVDRVEGAHPFEAWKSGSPSASRRQTACAPSRTSQARTSRWNKREVAPRARSWSTSCMMGGALRRRRCLPSARRASRLAWEKRFSLSGLLRFSAAFRQRCCEEGMP